MKFLFKIFKFYSRVQRTSGVNIFVYFSSYKNKRVKPSNKKEKLIIGVNHNGVEEFKLPGVGDIKEDDGKVIIVIHEHLDSVIKAVSNHKIRNMTLSTYSLEELFLKYYGKKESVEGGAS